MKTNILVAFLALGAPVLRAQYTVSDLSDSQTTPGTLRYALWQIYVANPPAATITLAVAGTTVCSTLLPYPPASTQLTIGAGFGAGRFTIDARPASAAAPIHGLLLRAQGTVVSAPLTVLIANGVGVEVQGQNCRIDDLEVQGGSQMGFAASGAHNLVAKRLRVTGSGASGIGIVNTDNARVGEAATGSTAWVRGRSGAGILIQGGSGNTIECFDVATSSPGILASGTSAPALGSASGPRCNASGNTGDGVTLQNVTGNAAARTLQRVDLHRNSQAGVLVYGGSNVSVADCACDQNVVRGASAEGGASAVAFDGLTCTNTGNGSGSGVFAGIVAGMVVRACTMGPGNGFGFQTYGQGLSTALRVEGGSASGNQVFGARFEQAIGTLVDGLAVSGNVQAGIAAHAMTAFVIKGCAVGQNQSDGLMLSSCPGVTIGPGNLIDGNVMTGITVDGCANAVVTGNPSIGRNHFCGIYALNSPGTTVTGTSLVKNQGIAIWVLMSDGCVIGPGTQIESTLGTAVKVETSQSCTIDACKFTRTLGSALYFINGTGTHTVRSCLIAENRDVGIVMRSSAPADIVGCTIVANYRGVSAYGAFGSSPTQARLDSCILRKNTLDDYGTADPYGLITVSWSFVQNPPASGTNRAADPLFADELAGDWRLAPSSPAIDASDPALSFPAGSRDAWGGARTYGARADCGAWESQPSRDVLTFFPDRMPRPGSKIGFQLAWPPSESGNISIVLFNLAGPGSVPLFGLNVPLAFDAWMVQSLSLGPPLHVNTVVPSVPATGVIAGSLDYGSLPLLPTYLYPLRIWATAFTVNLATSGSQVANVSYFEIR